MRWSLDVEDIQPHEGHARWTLLATRTSTRSGERVAEALRILAEPVSPPEVIWIQCGENMEGTGVPGLDDQVRGYVNRMLSTRRAMRLLDAIEHEREHRDDRWRI